MISQFVISRFLTTTMSTEVLIPNKLIESRIYVIRECKIMLDSDLAEFYNVETRVLNQAVKRHEHRFPSDFMFQLSKTEFEDLQQKETNWGGRRKLPMAFTEHGILMLSSVLNSSVAVSVSQQIIRLFISLRDEVLSNQKLINEIQAIKEKLNSHDSHLEMINEYLMDVLVKNDPNRSKIGYKTE